MAKIMSKGYFALVLVLAALLSQAGIAQAVAVSGSASTDVSVQSKNDAQIQQGTAGTSDSERMGSGAKLQAGVDTKVNASADTQRLLPTVNKDTDSDNDAASGIIVGGGPGGGPRVREAVEAKVTVKGWNPEKKEMIEKEVKAEAEAKTEIQSVDIDENNVTVTYSMPGKLFGFLPWNMTMAIVADADARVKVKLPWYRFMVKSDVSSDINAQADHIFQHNQSDLEFLKSKSSEDRQVEIFLSISAKMHEMSKSIIQNIKA
jgi:hypothetical protein